MLLIAYLRIHQNCGVINIDIKQIERFLERNPQMTLAPSGNNEYIIKGELSLDIQDTVNGNVRDEFLIQIVIPEEFPKSIPTIYELGNRFPKTADYHTFIDGSLCLGSPLSIRKRLAEHPDLEGYIHSCVVPYFYAISLKLQGNENYIFGELGHGPEGIIEDYLCIFDFTSVALKI